MSDEKIKTDSPYYSWASEIMNIARVPQSCVTMRIAELLKANLGGWLDKLDWCSDCDPNDMGMCDSCERIDPSDYEPDYGPPY